MMNKKAKSTDYEIAYNLEQRVNRFGITENAIDQNDKDYTPRTLIDRTLELIDPTPNVHTLFVQFNERFFSNVLLSVEVRWSNRMTSCAGTCTFHPRNRQCVIALSAPLLKLRPRKDLVETLLHEMIHGYLFLTNNNRDRDGHGPEFRKHMNRINQAAGTKITIYHSFHEEVRLHQQHWWRCDGPCQRRPPYFGMVRRATNHAPGPNDFWWKEHQRSCGGNYIKIKEPENYKSRNSKKQNNTPTVSNAKPSKGNMLNWLTKPVPPSGISQTKSTATVVPKSNSTASNNGFVKLGNNTNNVHGWGVGGPSATKNSGRPEGSNKVVSTTPKFLSSGTLGGSNSGVSNLLTKFSPVNKDVKNKTVNHKTSDKKVDQWLNNSKQFKSPDQNKTLPKLVGKTVECPICFNSVLENTINDHVDKCLMKTNDVTPKSDERRKRKTDATPPANKQRKLDFSNESKMVPCPICNKQIRSNDINIHIDKCFMDNDNVDCSTPVKLSSITPSKVVDNSIISISDSSESDISPVKNVGNSESAANLLPNSNTGKNGHKCLICDKYLTPEITLNDHLEDCIGTLFNDDVTLSNTSDCEIDEDKESSTKIDKYPCPVCMELISDSLMNQHLDACLKTD